MQTVTVYSTPYCPFCVRVKELLNSKKIAYVDIDVSNSPELRTEMEQKSVRRTVPQVFIGDVHVGGCDDLFALEQRQGLDTLLNA